MAGARLILDFLTRRRTYSYGSDRSQRADLYVPGHIAGEPRVRVERVVAQAGVCDLADAYRRWGGGAVRALMGGSPEELPERYAAGDPMRLLPLSMPALLVHGTLDETVSVKLSRRYERAARAAGSQVELVEVPGEAGRHRAHIDPRGAAWAEVTRRLPAPGSFEASPRPSARPRSGLSSNK